ncbi:MAG: adenylosuccinate synthase [Anaerofustis sp.]
MASLVIIGAQWGDEGKGKITDYLTDKADVVVRYQGGNNAGHTVIAKGVTYKLHLIPSGVVQNKPSIIGTGVALDPIWLTEEMGTLKTQGLSFEHLLIDKRTHLIMPYHKLMDALNEKALGDKEIGTTKRGVGPCYTDKTKRIGIRVCDLLNPAVFSEKLKLNLEKVNLELKELYETPPLAFQEIYDEYQKAAELIRPYVTDGSVVINQYIKSGKKVLFEGAQGTLLDIDYGTYPFVTSSHPTSAGVCIGAGVGPTTINEVVGIAKAYTTRVGKGPFPTEQINETGDFLREKGFEFGTTTGRPRRCGWLDMVILKYSARINGLTSIALTKLDTLTGLKTIKICTGYRYHDEIIEDFPPELDVLEECEPIYEEFEGWDDDITEAKSFEDLCAPAKQYVRRIEELCGVAIGMISVGPDRDQTIVTTTYFS